MTRFVIEVYREATTIDQQATCASLEAAIATVERTYSQVTWEGALPETGAAQSAQALHGGQWVHVDIFEREG